MVFLGCVFFDAFLYECHMWVAGRMVNLSVLALLPPAAEEPPPPVGKPPPVEEPAPTRAPRSPGQPPVTDLWFQTRLPEPSQMSLARKVAELNAKEDYIAKQQLDLKKMLANPNLEPAQEPGGASAGAASAAGAGPKAARKPCKKKAPRLHRPAVQGRSATPMTAVMLLHTRTVDQLTSKHLVLRQLELPLLRALAPRHLASPAKKRPRRSTGQHRAGQQLQGW